MKPILRISILLNLALAVAALLVLRKPNPTPVVVPGPVVAEAPIHSLTEAPPENLASNPPPEVVSRTNAFRWQALESTNYLEFVANLRQVGCPERTIRDLIFADAERRYAELQSLPGEPISFWLAGKARAAANRRNETARAAAQDALRAELRGLFGVDWSPEEGEARDLRFQALSRLVVGPVTDEQHERAWRWLMSTVELGQRFRSERNRIWLIADTAEWQKIVAAKQAQAEQIFGPVAYEEFQARTTVLEEMFDSHGLHLKELELTPEELRKVCLLKVREIGWLGDLFDLERNRSEEDLETKQAAFTAATKDVLSPENFEELVRVQDDDYRNILEVTRDNHLPRTSAQKIYEVRQLAEAEYRRLKAEADSDEKAAALAALQVTTTDSVRKVLGAEAFNHFTRHSGQWVTNFSKL